MLEILHFVPMLALAFAFFFGFYKSTKANLAIFSISLAGIIFGSVFHIHHHVSFFDPCIISITVAIYSFINIIRFSILGRSKSKAQA